MKEKLKSRNGITLIALIITIIILLILAMVTINILINQGIIGHAQNAVETYDEKQVKEDIALAYDEYRMQKFGANAKSLYDFFREKYDNVTDNGDGSITVTVTSNGKTYTVKLKEDGSMESMTGLSLDKTSITLEYEEGTPATDTIKATATDIQGDITWSIADNSIATISSTTGNQITVTSVKTGTTTITAKCGKYTKTCEVKVYQKLPIGEYINYKCYSTVADADKSKLYYKSPKEKTGYTSDQGFEVTEDVTWKILGRDNSGHILITTAEPVLTSDDKGLYLNGKDGYIYGPDELDEISRIYKHGLHAIDSRSINVEDINKITGKRMPTPVKCTFTMEEDGKIYTKSGTGGRYTRFTYPIGNPKNEWQELDKTNNTTIVVEDTYNHTSYDLGSSTSALKMLRYKEDGTTTANYWLASRACKCKTGINEGYVDYFIRFINYGVLGYYDSYFSMYNSYGGSNPKNYSYQPVRPVVTLDITEVNTKDDDGVWQIE